MESNLNSPFNQLLTLVNDERSTRCTSAQSAYTSPPDCPVSTPLHFNSDSIRPSITPSLSQSKAHITSNTMRSLRLSLNNHHTVHTKPLNEALVDQHNHSTRKATDRSIYPEFCPATNNSCICFCYPPRQTHKTIENISLYPQTSTRITVESLFVSLLQNVNSNDLSSTLEAAQKIFVNSVLTQACNTSESTKWLNQYMTTMRTAVSQIKETIHARLYCVETCYELRKLCYSVSSKNGLDETANKLWCIVRHQIVL